MNAYLPGSLGCNLRAVRGSVSLKTAPQLLRIDAPLFRNHSARLGQTCVCLARRKSEKLQASATAQGELSVAEPVVERKRGLDIDSVIAKELNENGIFPSYLWYLMHYQDQIKAGYAAIY